MNASMVVAEGVRLTTDVSRWFEAPSPEDWRLLDRVRGPVIDVGCGPGRHLHALAERGIVAMGVDVAASAVALARGRGAVALKRSVFDPLPGTGRWRSALLLDGNVGIGGDPRRLLARIRELLRFDGELFVEVEPPGVDSASTWARIEIGASATEWFPWARVAADDVPRLAGETGFTVKELWREGKRWFGGLCVAY
jgi:SAM-dependent methyltransferase